MCLLARCPTRLPPPAPALPEAPCSVNFRLTYHHAECQFTLRDTDETHLLQRLKALLDRLAPAAQAAAPADPAWCRVHNVAMQRHENGKGQWDSHRVAGGWCKGK